ncbi:BCCT family transporter [Lutibaculum baratangense]|uniref:High-affinity choline uptake protein BetT n=1 Tax=Lutibaculum baratangense AMV1 TaxID=631454 RepID=V4TF32_9HYPH|nr:BCCT family transporter [Lutibaculum baratangense]ESR24793.1 High-affinity choline uptake protein BetT [Lutibaculum baratangense AMV1]
MPESFRQPVFLISGAVILTFVILGAAFPEGFKSGAEAALGWVTTFFGWFYLISVFGFVVVLVYLAFSKYGETRIGPPDSTPDYSFFSWVAMLLAAGFGVGLVFYGLAEPMTFFLKPPYEEMEGGSEAAARFAIQYAFFDWGVHQWAAFSIVGLIIGYFQFRKGEAGLVSTTLERMTKRAPGGKRLGNAFDIFAVVATVVGVATSLGLGVLQINGGLNYVFGLPEGFVWQLAILGVMFGAYMVSAASGLDKGIKILSNINLGLAIALMLYILIFGPTLTILNTIVQGLGDYLQHFLEMSLRTDAFAGSEWASSWTIFYWAWVIAWSPFVGTFVARISRGRTIREYVFGVLVMPPLLACLWIGVYGGAGLHYELVEGAGLAQATSDNITTAVFHFFDLLPMSMVLNVLTCILIFIFLITSADSASYIVAQMTDKGSIDPPLVKRLSWGGLIAAICLTLIATGGLEGLQSAAVLAALPFTFILYAMVYTLFRELKADRQAMLQELYEKHDQTPVGASIHEARELADNGDEGEPAYSPSAAE